MSSQCQVCKQNLWETGNYSFVIHPAKRIPDKARKLITSLNAANSVWGVTKFQKYLFKRAATKNFCEIKCGNCKTTCMIPMTKRKLSKRSSSALVETPVSRRKRKKTPKDINAGLIIPTNLRSSVSSQKSVQPANSPTPSSRQQQQKRLPANASKTTDDAKKLSLARSIVQRSLLRGSDDSQTSSSLDIFLK